MSFRFLAAVVGFVEVVDFANFAKSAELLAVVSNIAPEKNMNKNTDKTETINRSWNAVGMMNPAKYHAELVLGKFLGE